MDPVLVVLLFAVGANLVLTAALLLPPALARRRARDASVRPVTARPEASAAPSRPHATSETLVDPAMTSDGVPKAAYDHVVRVVGWSGILAGIIIVALSGLWPDTETGILVVLALGGFLILAVHDIIPPGRLGTDKFVVEGCLAITLVTLIVIMTGQELSPFFWAYVLIVAGAALVVSPLTTVVLAGLATIQYVIALLVQRSVPLPTRLVPNVSMNIVALLLLAFIASYVAREQRRSRQAAIRLSTVDSLTGLFNRAYFFAAVEREIQRSSRTGRRFGLLMMDMDGLKAVNDRFGHYQGDQVLRSVAQVIRTGVRRIDTAARYGGDEFVVLLPETEPTGAYVLAEKIRLGVEDLGAADPRAEIRTSMSIGAVSYPDDGLTPDDLLISADRAMYGSKRQGKNRVVGYTATAVGLADDLL